MVRVEFDMSPDGEGNFDLRGAVVLEIGGEFAGFATLLDMRPLSNGGRHVVVDMPRSLANEAVRRCTGPTPEPYYFIEEYAYRASFPGTLIYGGSIEDSARAGMSIGRGRNVRAAGGVRFKNNPVDVINEGSFEAPDARFD